MNDTQGRIELRNAAASYEYTIDNGNIVVNPSQRTLLIADALHDLEPLVMSCFSLMLYHPGEPQRFTEIRGQESDASIKNAISKLRAKLRPKNKLIVTKHGAGYYFDGKVTRRQLTQIQLHPETNFESLSSGIELGDLVSKHNGVASYKGTSPDGHPLFVKLALSPQAERQVERECSIWQLLKAHYPDHPHLLQLTVSDFTATPKHFAAMQAGNDLANWAANGSLAALDRDQRLALFHQILDGVRALHQLGITHRDIKPSNILIKTDNAGDHQVRIGDLGSADLQNRGVFTAVDVRPIGLTVSEPAGITPVYAAPEIIAGHPGDSSSDIYSLGIVLFQLVRGDFQLPLSGGWQEGINDPALEDLIVDMTHSNRRLKSVDVAIDRLEQLAQRRIQILEANQLEKVKARRPWLAAIFGLALVAGFVSYRYAVALEVAKQEEIRKEQVLSFLSEFLSGAEPRNQESGPSPSLAAALHRASNQLNENTPQDPVIRLSIATLLGGIYAGLGDTDYRHHELERQVSLARELWGEPSFQLATRQYNYASILAKAGKLESAEELLNAIRQPANLTQTNTSKFKIAKHGAWAELYTVKLDYPQALEQFEAATAEFEHEEEQTNAAQLKIRTGHIGILARLGNIDQALDQATQLLATSAMQADDRRSERLTIQTLQAQLLGMSGKPEQSIEKLKLVIPDTLALYGTGSLLVARAYSVLGQQQNSIGDFAAAAESYEHAIRLYCRPTGGQQVWCNLMRGNLGAVNLYLGKSKQALATMEAVRDALTSEGAPPTSFAIIDFFTAHALIDIGALQRAAQFLESSTLELLEQAAPGAQWETRVGLLKARWNAHNNPNEQTEQAMQPFITKLRAAGVSEAALIAFSRVKED